MTTRTLTGTYSAGYTLKSNYNRLVIEASARVLGVGVVSNTGVAAIVNYGTVQEDAGGFAGVLLSTGGSVTNGSASDKTAMITGLDYGVLASESSPSVSVTNFGTIQNTNEGVSSGVEIEDGGTVTNGSAADTTALITGESGGVIFAANGTSKAAIINFGTILSSVGPGAAVEITSGEVTNGSTADHAALIEGPSGILTSNANP
jgi:hypothetical protein